MGKLSVLFLAYFILVICANVDSNVIPNHLNNLGLNINSINLNAHNVANEKVTGTNSNPNPNTNTNPLEVCLEKCKERPNFKASLGICKFNCENKHFKRKEAVKFEDCLAKCKNIGGGELQALPVCECRKQCDKIYPKELVW